MIVIDTSVVLYWTLFRTRLSLPATAALDQSQQILISSISVWEIGLKAKSGKLTLPLPVGEYVNILQSSAKVQIVSVTEVTWLKNLELNWAHQDPVDRTIVATASLLGCPLVTSDHQIRAFYPASIW